MSWEDAKAYVGWLSRKTGERYRLLSEAEWEYAARAGTTGPFHFGATISTDQANYNGNTAYGAGRKGVHRRKTVPVGKFSANGFRLHDMHGNVREWVEDCRHVRYTDAPTDGRAWISGGDCGPACSSRRLLGQRTELPPFRGTNPFLAENRSYDYGVRVARTLSP